MKKHKQVDYNNHKPNLYNTTDKKLQRTKKYIEDLEPLENWEVSQCKRFNARIKEVLAMDEANDMLDAIGFNPIGQDGIFKED